MKICEKYTIPVDNIKTIKQEHWNKIAFNKIKIKVDETFQNNNLSKLRKLTTHKKTDKKRTISS